MRLWREGGRVREREQRVREKGGDLLMSWKRPPTHYGSKANVALRGNPVVPPC